MKETWERMWGIWITDYRVTRPPSGPIGWYNLTDLRAAFDAGRDAGIQAGKLDLIDRLNAHLNAELGLPTEP